MDTQALIKLTGGFTRSGSCSRGCVCAPNTALVKTGPINQREERSLAEQTSWSDSYAIASISACHSCLCLSECANVRSI